MRLTIIPDPYDSQSWEFYDDVKDLTAALKERFGPQLPSGARLYHDWIAESNDVTPGDEEGIKRLLGLDGDIYCVLYPEEAATIIAVVIAVAAVVLAVALQPKPEIPSQAERNDNLKSSNNQLGGRTNEARPGARVPDIFGELRSYPDLIAPTYDEFYGNIQVENQLLCIGRGSYAIHDIRDGETRLEYVSGSSVEIYRPFADIVNDEPYTAIGPTITDKPWIARKSNSVNGQSLKPANADTYTSDGGIIIRSPNLIVLRDGYSADFTELFDAGDDLTLKLRPVPSQYYKVSARKGALVFSRNENILNAFSEANRVDIDGLALKTYNGRGPYGLDGVYTIVSAEMNDDNVVVTLLNPEAINPNWALLHNTFNSRNGYGNFYLLPDFFTDYSGTFTIEQVLPDIISLISPGNVNPAWAALEGDSAAQYGTIQTGIERWSDTIILDDPDLEEIWINLVAQNGLYKDSGQQQYAVDVSVNVECVPLDSELNPNGAAQIFTETINGSASDRDLKGMTIKISPSIKGRQSVRIIRTTPTDTSFNGNVVDDVKWRDCYSMSSHPHTSWGDFTIVRARTLATLGATSLKERKLNILVTRELPRWNGTEFTPELYPTSNFADILSFIALDPYIGRRSLNELDIAGFYETANTIAEYFGTDKAAEFCYTFDSSDLTFQDHVAMIAEAVFCQAYRQGHVLKIFFERETELSILLFNHRNTIPDSEKYTASFGMPSNHDGVSLEYVSPDDDAVINLNIPEDGSAINPLKIETVGIRNKLQAHFKAHREWQKMRYRHLALERDVTEEGNLLIRYNRILASDTTGGIKREGEVLDQYGLVAKSGRDLKLEADRNYTAFLQLSDGSVQSMQVKAGPDSRSFILDSVPRLPLISEQDSYARTTFSIVENEDEARKMVFLVDEKTPNDDGTVRITAINYDDRYYSHDKDYIKGLIRAREA